LRSTREKNFKVYYKTEFHKGEVLARIYLSITGYSRKNFKKGEKVLPARSAGVRNKL
jgi:hypothetical protein